ncbi:MAG: PorV/PorQ family protein [Elusimicrobia bacterium]|nr:PorV/PorQ family protein [Elusimicrobiota bacterium]
MVRKHVQGVVCLAALLCLGRSLPARAGGLASSGQGTTSAEFLRIPVGARPAGLADAFVGLADDVHALAYNPAGIAFLARQEVGMVFDAYAPGVNHAWTGYVHPLRFGTYGLAINALSVAPFEAYSATDDSAGQTSALDAAYQLSYGLRISDTWAVGGSGKYITSRLHTYNAATVAGDIGTLWVPMRGVRLGASVLHLGNGLRYISETYPLPITARVGASWTPYDPRDFPHYFTLALDGIQTQGQAVAVSGGVELWYQGVLAVRLGGRTDPGEGAGYTVGMGLYVFRDEHRPCELGFDYSFMDSGNLAQTHRASIVLKFGQTLREERRGTVIEWRRARDQAGPLRQRELERARQAPAARAPQPESKQTLPDSEMILSPDYKKWVRP